MLLLTKDSLLKPIEGFIDGEKEFISSVGEYLFTSHKLGSNRTFCADFNSQNVYDFWKNAKNFIYPCYTYSFEEFYDEKDIVFYHYDTVDEVVNGLTRQYPEEFVFVLDISLDFSLHNPYRVATLTATKFTGSASINRQLRLLTIASIEL